MGHLLGYARVSTTDPQPHLEGGSRIGARYRHTTPEMAVRVAAAIQQRLEVVVQVAQPVLETDGSGGRVF